jgi:hypothetical protein
MVNCPGCKQEFPAANIWAEVIQDKELENRRDLGDYIIFMCPLCQVVFSNSNLLLHHYIIILFLIFEICENQLMISFAIPVMRISLLMCNSNFNLLTRVANACALSVHFDS